MPVVGDYDYNEFAYFHENLAEWDLDAPIPPVQRFFVAVDGLRQVSGLRWADASPELVLVHGGAQNAHTFDTVALAMQRPLVAIDLPGHGHSDASPAGSAAFRSHANDLAVALPQVTTPPLPLVGMSLGGLTAIVLAATHPDLVSSLFLIDITPGVNATKAHHITEFVNGPKTFDDFDSLLERTVRFNPTRSVSSLRRGILHNAIQRPDGSWVWRHQQHPSIDAGEPSAADLWDLIESIPAPLTLIRGMAPGSVVDDEDEAELRRRRPDATVVHVADAGHSIQGDAPLELAALLERFCPRP